jgi:mRNA-degrading endonuclease RelE of RelBE toxin-antitoxin system
MTIRFHRLASRELRSALAWYRDRDLDIAIRFQAAVETAIERIKFDPDSHPLERSRFRWVRVRRFPYRVIFERIDSDTIQVIALVHARRREAYWRRRR